MGNKSVVKAGAVLTVDRINPGGFAIGAAGAGAGDGFTPGPSSSSSSSSSSSLSLFYMGPVGGKDAPEFDDVAMLTALGPRDADVCGLNVWANDIHVVAIQVCYRVHRRGGKPKLMNGQRHGGTKTQAFMKRMSGEGACRMQHIELKDREQITSVEIFTRRHGIRIKYRKGVGPDSLIIGGLKVSTNQREYEWFNKSPERACDLSSQRIVAVPGGSRFVGLFGYAGWFISGLGLICEPQQGVSYNKTGSETKANNDTGSAHSEVLVVKNGTRSLSAPSAANRSPIVSFSASATLKNSKEVVMAAVQQNGWALLHASDALKNDKEVVMAAVQQNRRALKCASAALRNDKEFVGGFQKRHDEYKRRKALDLGEVKSDHNPSANTLNMIPGPNLLRELNRELNAIKDGRWNVVKYLGGRAPSSATTDKGRSAVVLANDTRLGTVAIKFVSIRDAQTRRRFNRELIFLKRVAHTNVVRCLDGPFASADGTLMCGILEMLPGGSLRTIRERDESGRLGEEYVVQMAVDVLRGLAHAHDQHQGVVHKDLKCDNIVSSGEGFKIVDFGIACMGEAHLMDVSNTMLTQTTTRVIGTPHYMSPEQYRNQTASFPTDIWSIGVVMYRNLVGRFPFGENAASRAEISAEVLMTDFDGQVPNASPEITRIICKALQKDSAHRYSSASAMLADLTPLLKTKPLPPGCKWHFFICKHEAGGAQSAMNIYHELRARGYKVWISNDVKGPNKARMREGVRKSAVFLLYLTKGVFSRMWCRDVEMLEAVRHRKPFVLLRCKKGEYEFKMDKREAELRVAGFSFRSVGDQLFRQCEVIDWSLNATTRPGIVERLEYEYDRRAANASSLYDGVEGLKDWSRDEEHPSGIPQCTVVQRVARDEHRSSLNPPGTWDIFISYTQRHGSAEALAEKLSASLKERGLTVWLDVDMRSKSTAAMKEGVKNSACVVAIVTGPTSDGDLNNAYFSRHLCVSELKWAIEAGVQIQPVVRMEDKGMIECFLEQAPEPLKFLRSIDFIELKRSDIDYWNIGVEKLIAATAATNVLSEGIKQMYEISRKAFALHGQKTAQVAGASKSREHSQSNPQDMCYYRSASAPVLLQGVHSHNTG